MNLMCAYVTKGDNSLIWVHLLPTIKETFKSGWITHFYFIYLTIKSINQTVLTDEQLILAGYIQTHDHTFRLDSSSESFINLDDDEQAYPSTHLWRISIHACHNIYNGLSNGDDHSKHCRKTEQESDLQPCRNSDRSCNCNLNSVLCVSSSVSWQDLKIANALSRRPTFLSSVEEGSVFGSVSHLNDLGTSQQLHDKAWGDNGWDTQLHQSTWRYKVNSICVS